MPVGSSFVGLRPAVIIFALAGDNRLPGRALKGKYGLSAVKGSAVACVGLAPGPVYTGPAGLRA